jgi:hypothetical protein
MLLWTGYVFVSSLEPLFFLVLATNRVESRYYETNYWNARVASSEWHSHDGRSTHHEDAGLNKLRIPFVGLLPTKLP